MNRPVRRRRRSTAARRRLMVVAGMLVLLWSTPTAHADPPVAQGWWWVAQQEALLLPGVGPVGQVADMVPDQAGPQGVPDDGLYVAGSAAGDEAVATLRFFVPEGQQPTSLDLVLAGEPTGAPLIRLCAVTTEWTPVQRGTWDERPEFDCADDAPVGVVSEDATSVSFDLSDRTLAGTIDFGLAPALDDTGNPATFQAAFEKPGGDALVLPGGPAGDTPVTPTPAVDTGDSFDAPPATSAQLPDVPSAVGGVNLTPVATQPSTQTGGGTSEFAAPASPAALPMAPASSGTDMRTLGMVGLLALAGFYAWLTGQEEREPTSLLVFGRGANGPVIDAEVLR